MLLGGRVGSIKIFFERKQLTGDVVDSNILLLKNNDRWISERWPAEQELTNSCAGTEING